VFVVFLLTYYWYFITISVILHEEVCLLICKTRQD